MDHPWEWRLPGRPHSCPGRRHSQGWSIRRDYAGYRHLQRADADSGTLGSGHDGRNHASWQSAGHRRIEREVDGDRKSTRLNSSHLGISYAVFCLKKKIWCRTTARAAWRAWWTLRRACFPSTARICVSVFFNDTATTEIYTLSLHDALPI